jgi:hypothetical protein
MPPTISPEQAAKQQSEIKPPQTTVQVPEAPQGAAPGTHPAVPIESDPEVLAEWQGAKAADRQAPTGRWSQNYKGDPVFIRENPPSGRRQQAQSQADEPVLPPGQRGEENAGQPQPPAEAKGKR